MFAVWHVLLLKQTSLDWIWKCHLIFHETAFQDLAISCSAPCIPLLWFRILPQTVVLSIVLQHCNNCRLKIWNDKFIMIDGSWESCRVLVKTLSWRWGELGKAEYAFLDRNFRSNRLNPGYDSESLALFQLVQCSPFIIDSLQNHVTY
jgi:hypothetical protein